MTETNKVGRPTDYTKELADKMCAELAEGKSLRTVCNSEEYPSKTTIFRWLRENTEFRDQYEKAKEECADRYAEEIVEIADDGTNDYMEKQVGENTIEVVNTEHIQRSRLRVDARKWVAAKLKPKKYGDKMDVTSDGKAIKGNSIIFSNFKDEN